MTSAQLINILPLNVTALEDLATMNSSNGGFLNQTNYSIKKGTNFKINSAIMVSGTNGTSYMLVTNIPFQNSKTAKLALRTGFDSIIKVGNMGTPILNAIKIVDRQAILYDKIYASIDGIVSEDFINKAQVFQKRTNTNPVGFENRDSKAIPIKKYIFTKELSTGTFVPSGLGIATSMVNFKKGDIIEGRFVHNEGQSESDYVETATPKGIVRISFNNREGSAIIPYNPIPTENKKVENSGNSNKSKLSTDKSDSLFTTKNIVIGIAVIGAVFGLLKWKKII